MATYRDKKIAELKSTVAMSQRNIEDWKASGRNLTDTYKFECMQNRMNLTMTQLAKLQEAK